MPRERERKGVADARGAAHQDQGRDVIEAIEGESEGSASVGQHDDERSAATEDDARRAARGRSMAEQDVLLYRPEKVCPGRQAADGVHARELQRPGRGRDRSAWIRMQRLRISLHNARGDALL